MLSRFLVIQIIILGLRLNYDKENPSGFLTNPIDGDYLKFQIKKEGKKIAEREDQPVMSRKKFESYVKARNLGQILDRICPVAPEGTHCNDEISRKENDPSLEWPKIQPGGSFGTVYMHLNQSRSTKVIQAETFSKMVYALGEINLGRKFFESSKMRTIANLVWTDDCCSETIKIQQGGKQISAMKFYLRQPAHDYGNLRFFMVDMRNLPYFMDADWKVKILLGIKNGLYILHDGNYIHRDLKPENIVLFKPNVPLLSDFAFSVDYKHDANVKLAGTPIYMPSEALGTDSKPSFSFDIYSFGILMFEILNVNNYRLTGEVISEIADHCKSEFATEKKPSEIEKDLYCKYFHHLVLQMVDSDPEKRPNIKQVSEVLLKNGEKYIEEWNSELINYKGCGVKPANLPDGFEELIARYEAQLWEQASKELSEGEELDAEELSWADSVWAYHCFYDDTKHYLISSRIVAI